MNHDFLIGSAQLKQAFESHESGGSGGGITRRSFIKRAGGVTVASLVAWSFSIERAKADIVVGGVSYFLKCTGDPYSNPAPIPVTLAFPFGDIVLKLIATSVGPHRGDEADSFSFRGTKIKAEITCAKGILQPGSLSSDTWNSGTHTIWLDASAATQESKATPTPLKKLIASYDFPAGGFVSLVWNISTSIRRDVLSVNTAAVMARYESPSGLLIIHADENTIKTYNLTSDEKQLRAVYPVISPPHVRSTWRTGKSSRR